MNDSTSPREFRIKRGNRILALAKSLSATEKTVFIALVIIAAASALLLARRAAESFMVTVPGNGGSLSEGIVGLPRAANPVLAFADADQDVASLVYSGLMKRMPDGSIVPALAAAYTVSPDGLTYDFTLRDGLAFDDGAPLTADDVVFTVQKAQDPALKSPRRAAWADVTVRKVSDRQVAFSLKQPYADFLSNATMGILPQHIWKNISDDQFVFSSYNIQPVGDGPYRVASVAKDASGVPQSYTLVPSARYAGEHAHIGSIVLRFYADESHAFAALERGEIDSMAGLAPDDAKTLASLPSAPRLMTVPLPRVFGVFFNQNQNPVLADAAVRKALSLATDRQALVGAVLDGYGLPVSSPVPATFLAADAAAGPNVSGATSTLEKAGWKKGPDGVYAKTANKKTVQLAFSIATADSPDLKAAAEMVAAEWRALGAKVDVSVFEYGDLEKMIGDRSYDALLFGEYVGLPSDLYAFWHSSQRNAPGLNVAGYVNAKADKALSAIRSATSTASRTAALSAFKGVFADDMPAVMLYSPDFVYAVPAALQGVAIGSISAPSDRFDGAASWYVETEHVWPVFKDIGL